MESILKKFKVIIISLVVILISLIAFWGVFKQEKGVWKNVMPEYKFSRDLLGQRELKYIVDTTEEEKYVYVDENGNIKGEVLKDGEAQTPEKENESSETEQPQEDENDETEEKNEEVPFEKVTKTIKANEEEALVKENFEKSKKIIQERLNKQKIGDYNIRIDDLTGKMIVETTNEDIDVVEEAIGHAGKFEMIDYQNGLTLMDNSYIKNVSVLTSNQSAYKVLLQIEFNKEGSEKLKEISQKYIEIKNEEEKSENSDDETVEESNTEEDTEKKCVSITFDGQTMMVTYFGEEMTAGILQLAIGEETEEYDKYIENYNSAQEIADRLNTGIMPIKYVLETDNFVKSEITEKDMKIAVIIGAIFVLVISIIFIAKFKVKGIMAALLAVGYIAILSIVIRYTNVIISLNAIVALVISIIINYVFMYMLLNKIIKDEDQKAFNNTMKDFYLSIIPLIVIAVIFTFSVYTPINTIGMVIFWEIILETLYNFVFVKTIFGNK